MCYKIQVMMMTGHWQDCQRLATHSEGKWSTPTFPTVSAAQAAIDAEPDVAEWQRQNVVAIVPVFDFTIWQEPSRFNFKAFDDSRQLLGNSFIAYVSSGYYSHERLRAELKDDERDAVHMSRLETQRRAGIGTPADRLRHNNAL